MESWNDDRLDELSGRVDDGFKAVDQRFTRVEQEVKDGFAKADREMKDGFEKLDGEMKAGFKAVADRFEETPTREEMNKGFAGLRSEMNAGFAEVRSGYSALNRNLVAGALAIIAALIKFHG